MNAIVKTNAFKSGNSVAVRLPKALGIKEGDVLLIKRTGSWIEIRHEFDPEEQRARLAALLGDGFHASSLSPDALAERLVLLQAVQQTGRC